MGYDLSKSCENTLLVYVNACIHHAKNYHYRSQRQTLGVKRGVYAVDRSFPTLNRENARLREEKLILQHKRTVDVGDGRKEFTSSLTHVTWKGVMLLIRRKAKPYSFIRVWERICRRVRKQGPVVEEVEPEITGYFLGVPMRKGFMAALEGDDENRLTPDGHKKNT